MLYPTELRAPKATADGRSVDMQYSAGTDPPKIAFTAG